MPDANDDLPMDELFRRAIREAQASPFADYAVSSLIAAVGNNEVLRRIAAEEMAPRAAELELHLNGEDVRDHSTNARSFGILLIRIAEASKQYVKDKLNIPRLAADLLVAPGPGSVRATFLAPDPSAEAAGTFPDAHPKGPVWTHSNVQSESLHKIAVVLANANPNTPESEALDGAIQQLPATARRQLEKAVAEVVKRDWSLSGEFRQRGIGVEPVELGPEAARYLSSRLKDDQADVDQLQINGVVDGHRWSTGLMFFRPVGGLRPFHASFESTEIQEHVAALAAVPDRAVNAAFTVYVYHGPGTGDSGRRSYVLTQIEALDDGPAITLDGIDP
jgi:hypothetical protein